MEMQPIKRKYVGLLCILVIDILITGGGAQEPISLGPTCEPVDSIPHGHVNATTKPPFKVGSSLTFKCDSGYKAYGKPVITCMSNGRWSDPVSYCKTTICQRDTSKLEDGRKCKKSCKKSTDCKGQYKKCRCDDWCGRSCFNPDGDCDPLLVPENGYIIGDKRSYGRTVTYGCNDGFVLVGRSTRRCLSDRSWTWSPPECVAFSVCGKIQDQAPSFGYVTEGTDAELGAWPWYALLFYNSYDDAGQLYNVHSGFGGGSIIDNKWILTAGHVFDKFWRALRNNNGWENEFLIALGFTAYPKEGQEIPDHVHVFQPAEVYRHPEYHGPSYNYDVALIRIGNRLKRVGNKFVNDSNSSDGLIKFTRYIRPICLPCMKKYPINTSENWWNSYKEDTCNLESAKLIKDGEEVWVAGFGYIKYPTTRLEEILFKPDVLQEGRLKIWSEDRCSRGYQVIYTNPDASELRYSPSMFCAGSALESKHVDSCQGDSGGAIVKQIQSGKYWIQLGIVSWGWECGTNLPGFYVRLPFVMSWIVRVASGNRTGIRCLSPLSDPAHGQIATPNPKGYYEFEDIVFYTCNRGYDLMGASRLECLSDGSWNNEQPTCRIKSCGRPDDLISVKYSHIIDLDQKQFEYMENLTVECDDWYEMKLGSHTWLCEDSKEWVKASTPIAPNPPDDIPKCYPKCGLKGAGDNSLLGVHIFGGQKSLKHEWPWMVFLNFGKKNLRATTGLCGGSLISPNYVLTAAHCMNNTDYPGDIRFANRTHVWLGVHNRLEDPTTVKYVETELIIVHPKYYKASIWDYDVALIRLRETITMGTSIRPVCLPSTMEEFKLVMPEKTGEVIGWGLYTTTFRPADKLMHGEFPIVSHTDCWASFQARSSQMNRHLPEDLSLTKNMFCAGDERGSQSTCQGDAGVPFVMAKKGSSVYYQLGLVSFGIDNGCGDIISYTVYTRLHKEIVDWIMEKTNNLE